MRRLIAIPVHHLSCSVGIDKGRAWSVVEEVLLWAVDRSPRTIDELATAASLQRSLIVASLARMMRFRLVEVSVLSGRATFRSSRIGAALVGRTLPYFPTRIPRRVSFVIDRATGGLFRRRDVRLMPLGGLARERQQGVDVRLVRVEGGEPTMSPDANFQRLAELSVRGYDEQLATVEGRTASRRDDEVMVIDVVDGVATGLPRDIGGPLRGLVERLAREPGRGDVTVKYVGSRVLADGEPKRIRCAVHHADVLVGGEAHKLAFLSLLEHAVRQVVVHSTFLAVEKFEALRDAFRAACRRGVHLDVLWGAEVDEDTMSRNAASASRLMALVRDDPDLAGRVRVHMRATGSHAKVLLSDAANEEWVAVVGSCNWLLSPFRAVELSAILRDPRAVAEVARSLGRLVGRRGAAFDELAAELGLLAQDLGERQSSAAANGEVVLLEGEAHERIARTASGSATRRLVIGSHRLGATARPGALLQSAAAAARSGVDATVLYTRASGPVAAADATALEEEMAALKVTLIRASPPKLHAKFLAWDDNDVVVTSFNWASATVDPAFPQSELGVHLHAPGLAADVLRRVSLELPELVPAARTAARPRS